MSDQCDHPETEPIPLEKQPPPTTKTSSTPTSGNGFKTIPYIQPEELAELMAQGPTTIFYSAKKTTSMQKPLPKGPEEPS
jgi:hypothetical protein